MFISLEWLEDPRCGGDGRLSVLAVDIEMVAMAFERQKKMVGQSGNKTRLGSQLWGRNKPADRCGMLLAGLVGDLVRESTTWRRSKSKWSCGGR